MNVERAIESLNRLEPVTKEQIEESLYKFIWDDLSSHTKMAISFFGYEITIKKL